MINSGISRRDYRLIQKGLKKLNHVCPPCSEAAQELSDPNSTMPMDISQDMHSTMIDSSQVHGTFHLQVSIESVTMPPQSPTPPSPALSLPPPPTPPSPALSLPPPPTPPSPTALQLPQNWTFPPPPSPLGPSPPSPLSSGFDISRHGSADTTMYAEQSLDERPMSQTILEDAGEVTYDVIKEGTIRKKPKLVTSDGHSYVIKAKQEAVRHIELRPTMFVDEAMTSLFGSKDSRIPKTKSVIRKMHRAREGVLPKQPKNLDFEFDDEFLKEPFWEEMSM
ncbi:putative Polycomb group protein ASXL3 [Mercenaria mercenaria]|uniref:putative Polycomb group protein ASXL3 n=1 Tax=Mercenaria mercenaria TaxID=6596 RepID=UPI00234E9571|nr:putative Polycomb group protein ASXL3 [Mercenaria mercenaria]